MLQLLSLFFCLIISVAGDHSVDGVAGKDNKVLVILLDGFRHDYVKDQSEKKLPGFNRLLKAGVQANYSTPAFPASSYPGWTTVATGLWAEKHGIVGNNFYDAEHNYTFELFDNEKTGRPEWWTAEPIWATSSRLSVPTAVISFSRCDVAFENNPAKPDCEPFDFKKSQEWAAGFKKNVAKAIDKLKEKKLVMLYDGHINNIGQKQGPETPERKKAVRDIDATIVYLLDELQNRNMTDKVNIVIVGGHGIADVGPGAKVNQPKLDSYLEKDSIVNIAEYGAYSNIKVKEGQVPKVYDKLKKLPGVDVYKHEEIPEEFHYRDNKYIHDILLVAHDDTYIIGSSLPVQIPKYDSKNPVKGASGYDPRSENMRTIFFASGPDFKGNNSLIPAIRNVDIYPLLCELLHIKPNPNNGSLDVIKGAFNISGSARLEISVFSAFVAVLLAGLLR